jgi:excisionase family DNA binding protein
MLEADFLNCQEAARRLGCTRQHVSRLIRRGDLTGRKVGRDWIVARDSVEQYAIKRENFHLPLDDRYEATRSGQLSGDQS